MGEFAAKTADDLGTLLRVHPLKQGARDPCLGAQDHIGAGVRRGGNNTIELLNLLNHGVVIHKGSFFFFKYKMRFNTQYP